MLPTPDTSHVPYTLVYEPAEDSFLFLDTLSSPSETAFLTSRLSSPSSSCTTSLAIPAPLVLEVGSGSGVVTAFLTSNAATLFGTAAVLTLSTDVNLFACKATARTTEKACRQHRNRQRENEKGKEEGVADGPWGTGTFLACLRADLTSPFLPGSVDVLVFNPPYVPTPAAPQRIEARRGQRQQQDRRKKQNTKDDGETPNGIAAANAENDDERRQSKEEHEEDEHPDYEEESYLLELSYAGGEKGMEVTNRLLDSLPEVLSPRGCAYVLLCAQNKPEEVKKRIRAWDMGIEKDREWLAETVGSSGRKAGWEKLEIVRIWRA